MPPCYDMNMNIVTDSSVSRVSDIFNERRNDMGLDTEQTDLMTLKEVMARLHITYPTVRSLRLKGELPCIYLGQKSPRFRRDDVERLAEKGIGVPR